ncbi:TPR-like protein [Glonium stellatum]|uniref:TPR-like protein n=1 Tax=Glonium stellatum TaxID=574774 RepID=A0A8E2JX18_9PEZI|nr:TPR-like protein [Glonium stellatum]
MCLPTPGLARAQKLLKSLTPHVLAYLQNYPLQNPLVEGEAMSGVEVLGVVAAVSQLTKYWLEVVNDISEFSNEMRGASSRINRLNCWVQDVIAITNSIKAHSGSQDGLIGPVVARCGLEAEALQSELQKLSIIMKGGKMAKIKGVILFNRKEKGITRLVESIERSKSTINICLLSKVSETLMTTPSVFERGCQQVDDQLSNISREVAARNCFQFPKLPVNHSIECASSKTPASVAFMVNIRRNGEFIGQNSILEDLSEKMKTANGRRRVALIGLGGVGKSQIALEYAYRAHISSPNKSVFWIQGANELDFEQDFIRIAPYAKAQGAGITTAVTCNMVKGWLESENSGNWLLIVDDVNTDTFFGEKLFHTLLPQNPNGSILFTCRNKQLALKFVLPMQLIKLRGMNNVDARELLLTHAGSLEDSEEDIDQLICCLEYMPLAMVRAGAYIAANSLSVSGYLQLFNESEANRANLLGAILMDSAASSRLSLPIVTSVISLQKIQREDELAIQFIAFMSCLSSRRIPNTLLPSPKSTIKNSQALGVLKAYSLIVENSSDGLFDMHPLVRLATRTWLKSTGQFSKWVLLAFNSMIQEFPSQTEKCGDIEKCELYLSHADTILKDHEKIFLGGGLPAVSAAHGSLISRISRYLTTKGSYRSARTFAESAVKWNKRAFGERGRHTLTALSNLAVIDHYLGGYSFAENLCIEVLVTRTKVLGENHEDTIDSLNNLALLYQEQGKHDAAEGMHRKALSLREKFLGPRHKDTLVSVNNLALALQSQQKHSAAEDMLQRALCGRQDLLGPFHPDTLTSTSNLGVFLQSQKHWEDAWEMHSLAFAGRQKIFGPDHHETLKSKGNLALVLQGQGLYNQAEEVLGEVLSGFQVILRNDHPDTLTTMSNLANLYRCQSKYAKAEKVTSRVLCARQKELGECHPETLSTMCDLSILLQCQRKYQAAKALGVYVLNARIRSLGEGHRDTQFSARHVTELQEDLQEWIQNGGEAYTSESDYGLGDALLWPLE